MRKLLFKFIALSAFLAATLAPMSQAFAYNPLAVSCENPDAATATACQGSGGDPLTGPGGLIPKITLIIAIIAGFAAVVVMVLAGIRYITSGGAADQVAQAKKTIIFAAAGLIIIVLSQALISFVIGRI